VSSTKRSLPSWLPLAAGLAAAVVAMLLIWLLFIKAEDEAGDAGGPEIVQTSGLSDAAKRLGHPIYWIGERTGASYELAESDNGRVYVRYLDRGADAGVRSTQFVTVATYPVRNATAALRRGLASRPEAELARADNGALLLIDPKAPGSIRLAYPGADQQVELYTPDVAEGIRLAKSGAVQPVP